MKNSILGVFAIATLVLALASCNKYEEGPAMSLRSKKGRLAGDWKLTEVKVNGAVQNISGMTIQMKIEKDGKYTSTYTMGSFSGTETGKWEFYDKKTKLITTPDASPTSKDTTTILMLKNKMLKFKDVDGSNTTESTYEQ